MDSLFTELWKRELEWANSLYKYFEKSKTDASSLQKTNNSVNRYANNDIEAADLFF